MAGAQPPGDGGWTYRDKEPPPGYDGTNPQSKFKAYLRDLELWQACTDVPEDKQGLKLVQVLSGAAKAAVDTLTVKEIKGVDGFANVLKKLKEAFEPYVETALPRAMEGAFYGQPRGHKESMSEFLIRFQRAQAVLKDEGVTLPVKASGYLLFRQANLDNELEARMVTWLGGDYSLDTVITNLRRLERVHAEGGKRTFLVEEEEPGDMSYDPVGVGAEVFLGEPAGEDESEDENWVFMEDGHLDQVLEEDEVLDALASYQQVRRQIKEQKLGRQFFKPGDRGPGKGKGAGGGRDRSRNFGRAKGEGKDGKGESRRIHIEQLKLRTRCRNCGQVGRWSRECKAPPSLASSTSRPPSSVATGSAATGSQRSSFYWTVPPESPGNSSFFTFLDALKEASKRTEAAAEVPSSFVVTADHQGLVDTAAQEGLIGRSALLRLLSVLRKHNLRAHWTDKEASARGIGGSARTVGVCELPVGVAGVPGVLETTVVTDDVPLLLPVSLLKALGAIVNMPEAKLQLTAVNAECLMVSMASGHLAVSVVDFGPQGWSLPSGCQGIRQERDFRLSGESGPQQQFGFHSMCARPPQEPRRRVHDRARLALRNWRVILDKLCSVMLWGRWHTAVSDWMPAPLPAASSRASGTSSEAVALAPTSKSKLYRDYLNGGPKKLTKIKGIP
ncbi:GIP, partial [Symbiodinium necroappetens]